MWKTNCLTARKILVLLSAVFVLNGCGTIGNSVIRAFDEDTCKPPVSVYGGVILDGQIIYTTIEDGFGKHGYKTPAFIFAVVDMPLSAVADTLMLPVTIPVHLSYGKDSKGC
ncbi:MAG: YceK/YidQ family lipoprotein [Granulosicoccus sp.]